ncbi:unnamed protein product [Didymodactylos carnosus]|uniref:Uncharacterized protein n=1 Tax=Didymodactylos carnosus TaxID=1234261 RepID=A0A8S2TLT2_9BILA|nr:unnamed protein product [Didymodactylos carnosus]CAF4295916.1 unnamed protein product [Didymodactylos carnosus]
MALSRNIIFLINILCILLAIAAFLTQFFAVVTHHWKYQRTQLKPLLSTQQRIRDDSRLDQRYGLFSRNVQLYSNNDQQMDVWTSTKFPLTNDQTALEQCYSNTPSLRGVFLTCSENIQSGPSCHCARYDYWNAFISFEIIALILLGLVVLISALLTTHFQEKLKPIGIGLSLLAFLFILIGLILLGTHLKRELEHLGHSLPVIKQRLLNKIGTRTTEGRQRDYSADNYQEGESILRRAIKRQTDYYRTQLQSPYNETHYYQFSEKHGTYILYPYLSSSSQQQYSYQQPINYGQNQSSYGRQSAVIPPYTDYTNRDLQAINRKEIFRNSRAWIGWSAILSIISLILSLLYPLLLAVSWLMGGGKKEKKEKKENTKILRVERKTTHEYTPVSTVPIVEPQRAARYIPVDYDSRRPMIEEQQQHRQSPHDTSYRGAPRDTRQFVRDMPFRDDQRPLPEHYQSQRQYSPHHAHRQHRHDVDRQLPVNIDVSSHSYHT